MSDVLERIKEFWSGTSQGQKLTLGVATAGVVIATILFLSWSGGDSDIRRLPSSSMMALKSLSVISPSCLSDGDDVSVSDMFFSAVISPISHQPSAFLK